MWEQSTCKSRHSDFQADNEELLAHLRHLKQSPCFEEQANIGRALIVTSFSVVGASTWLESTEPWKLRFPNVNRKRTCWCCFVSTTHAYMKSLKLSIYLSMVMITSMRSRAKVAEIQSQFLHQCHWCAEKMKYQFNYNSGFGVQINDVGYATCKSKASSSTCFQGASSSP